eukprot:g48719.t1
MKVQVYSYEMLSKLRSRCRSSCIEVLESYRRSASHGLDCCQQLTRAGFTRLFSFADGFTLSVKFGNTLYCSLSVHGLISPRNAVRVPGLHANPGTRTYSATWRGNQIAAGYVELNHHENSDLVEIINMLN